jgi:hypothetical protein
MPRLVTSYALVVLCNRWSRRGHVAGTTWADKVQSYVDAWADAPTDVVQEQRPHSGEAYTRYLQWYLPRTRVRVMHVPAEPSTEAGVVSDTYPVRRDQNAGIAVSVSNIYIFWYYLNILFLVFEHIVLTFVWYNSGT